MNRLTLIASILVSAASVAAKAASPLPEPEEISAALEAAPEHLRAAAGVYVLEKDGYRLARASRNGFHCLIDRDLGIAFEPKCFDIEGSDTLLPVIRFRAEQRAHDVAERDIDRLVAARFARGEFVAPRRVGICYMLSPHNLVVTDRDERRTTRVGARLMFYAPYLSNADVGATPDLESRISVSQEGSESAMIVVPVASEKRTRTFYLSPDDLTPLTRAPASASTDPPPRDSFGKSGREGCGGGGRNLCRIDTPPPRSINPMP